MPAPIAAQRPRLGLLLLLAFLLLRFVFDILTSTDLLE
jgi:hypothetical protein